ncbi:MAG: hypothetical protein JKY95_11055 [Planctomycetaceae bacterium]|nr:hypothetical protein [Planctomycetaceae bacterium]
MRFFIGAWDLSIPRKKIASPPSGLILLQVVLSCDRLGTDFFFEQDIFPKEVANCDPKRNLCPERFLFAQITPEICAKITFDELESL